MADPRLRQLSIKTGVVKRLTKEKVLYEKEILTEEQRLNKFKSEGADEHVLRKQEEVIQECRMIVPDSMRRLKKEYEILEKFLEDETELREEKEYALARQVLMEAKETLNSV